MNTFQMVILEKFSWPTIFLLCDLNDQEIIFYTIPCAALSQLLKQTSHNYAIRTARFNSGVAGYSTELTRCLLRVASTAGGRPYDCAALEIESLTIAYEAFPALFYLTADVETLARNVPSRLLDTAIALAIELFVTTCRK
ncbi:hypothetical protein RvY_08536 [Ramazzottius varieornatus]|uniref:Uncharacterized protein n=1 Tax=Ramazzottius varieornatus TaxID=947166 RepID=A0A1D1V8U2_RAMVA|nr:hypothetical protein RvY_08536 [Ramazzottius varieornatus]